MRGELYWIGIMPKRFVDRLKERVEKFREGERILPQKMATGSGQELNPQQKRLAEEFRSGIASALGVPKEAIREDKVEEWVREYTEAFVRPGFQTADMKKMGQDLGRIIKQAGKSSKRSSPPSKEKSSKKSKTSSSQSATGV